MHDIFGGQKRIQCISISLPILLLREKVTEPGAADSPNLAIPWAPGICLSPLFPPQGWGNRQAAVRSFYVGDKDPNWCPQACTVSNLPAAISPAPEQNVFVKNHSTNRK